MTPRCVAQAIRLGYGSNCLANTVNHLEFKIKKTGEGRFQKLNI